MYRGIFLSMRRWRAARMKTRHYPLDSMSPLVKKIYTVERIRGLQLKARQLLRDLGIYNVEFRPGDGWEGWRKYGPYDGIIVTAAATELPEKLLEQLAPGGRMIIPVGPPGCQDLLQVTRKDDHFEQVSLGAVSFVPLVHGK
jgi:protein-L-isoaspartate(D-aspartate) O-methyltransferase